MSDVALLILFLCHWCVVLGYISASRTRKDILVRSIIHDDVHFLIPGSGTASPLKI
ncbi:uncharacterized protein BP01DRAFT_183520 [Aspergillus saccharolyticus JOP 1030-1]|uniref:Uncharacterized protein n=1 Tax=Aspergillus saccharolyticus JOP 1030-1 TaxID=1450539 RepID=A0A318ZLV9_9EURO|nr:hypothetical protein BP01DRAFT_183520 [Aspergillus saccharolyticus JOP 1030-1]PYH41238.1 hypothetical protein BP01DRAFT_183520 [Aspergillus saccharolyticus JOP 1030-1]